MLRGYWCIGLAFVALFSANGVAQDRVNQADPQADSAQQKQASQPTPTPLTKGYEITAEEKAKENRKEERDEEDLIAQKSMANAAQEQVELVWWQNALTSGEMLFLGITIFFTGWAAIAASKAAKAASQANNITTESAERQDRAYLTVEPGGINRTKSDRAVGDVIVRNVGRIPAKNVKTYVRIKSAHSKDVGKLGWPTDGVDSDRAIQPGGEMRRSSTGTTAIKNIDDPKVYVYVWGIVNYDDGFGRNRFTRFCHRYPGAWTTRRKLPERKISRDDPRSFLAMRIESEYADELIPARFARHQDHDNDAD